MAQILLVFFWGEGGLKVFILGVSFFFIFEITVCKFKSGNASMSIPYQDRNKCIHKLYMNKISVEFEDHNLSSKNLRVNMPWKEGKNIRSCSQ